MNKMSTFRFKTSRKTAWDRPLSDVSPLSDVRAPSSGPPSVLCKLLPQPAANTAASASLVFPITGTPHPDR
jgi:hypothetical protein